MVRWDDLVELGSHAEVSGAGRQRLEGKTYVVEDGDVPNIRFNIREAAPGTAAGRAWHRTGRLAPLADRALRQTLGG